MKPHRQTQTAPSQPMALVASWSLSNRAASLGFLSLPIALAVLAFVLAVSTTLMGEMTQGTARFYLAAFSYTYLLASFLWLPAYAISYGWYWWKTRQKVASLGKNLLYMPLIMVAFVWLPSGLFPPVNGASRMQVFFLLALSSLIVGYLWIALTYLVLRIFRKL